MRPPTQVLKDLLFKLTALLTAEISPMNQAQHNAEIAKLRDEVAQAKKTWQRRMLGWQRSELLWMLRHNGSRLVPSGARWIKTLQIKS